ncbi:response regulator [Zhihengliuella halotolerans]|uniref:LuxR family two component transcriptional regulator n=1 Tax=Zhihengliuella halotolerans TaxID=370736 RepID=A0A4Q8ABL6_9MICC|nr:response regulator transcription factor [Zhihengliuella halotolerans]RZU60933.1 LuxR family two component transcriptional regulator [Zhihengliuella halotolerans]
MTASEEQINVLIVDDHERSRLGNRLVLNSVDDITVVGEAATGEEAIAQVEALKPDVVLMDVRMPGMDGIEATRLITGASSAVRVVVLTTFDLDRYAFGSLQAGASAFLLKSATPDTLINAVRVVSQGDAVVEPRITRRLIDAFVTPDEPSGTVSSRDERLDRLSPREIEVLSCIGRGLSNQEISDLFFLSAATVKTHVNRIFAKLDLRDRVQAVILAREQSLHRDIDPAL